MEESCVSESHFLLLLNSTSFSFGFFFLSGSSSSLSLCFFSFFLFRCCILENNTRAKTTLKSFFISFPCNFFLFLLSFSSALSLSLFLFCSHFFLSLSLFLPSRQVTKAELLTEETGKSGQFVAEESQYI